MPEFTLYHAPGACSRVTMNALEECGITYEDRIIDLPGGEQKTPTYLAINPRGKVPALLVDGTLLTENAAILMYLAALKPEAGLLPVTGSALDQATCHADLIWCSATLHPMVRQVRMPIRYTNTEDTTGIVAKGTEYLDNALPQIEARVSNDRWWYDDSWSILDVYVCWCYNTAASAGYALDAYPGLLAHRERVKARPSFKATMAREKAALKAAG